MSLDVPRVCEAAHGQHEASETRATRVIHYYFSGPASKPTGIESYFAARGLGCVMVDIVNGAEFDLACAETWRLYEGLLMSGGVCGCILSPPCSTFSAARGLPGGPKQLRGIAGAEVYGFKTLAGPDKAKVSLGNLLALRSATIMRICLKKGVPFVFENPWPRPGCTSITLLPEIASIMTNADVTTMRIDQCRFGAATTKPTLLLLYKVDFRSGSMHCTHPRRWWLLRSVGKRYHAAHPRLEGKEWAVLEDSDNAGLSTSSAEYLTRDSAAYPERLNEYIASALTLAVRKSVAEQAACSAQHSFPLHADSHDFLHHPDSDGFIPSDAHGADSDGIFIDDPHGFGAARIDWITPLKPMAHECKSAPFAIGGLRCASKSLLCNPSLSEVGLELKSHILAFMRDHPEIRQKCLCALGTPKGQDAGMSHLEVPLLRDSLAKWLSCSPLLGTDLCTLWANGLAALRALAGDPDDQPEDWLRHGAPMGLRNSIGLRGVFPPSDTEEELDDPEALATESDWTPSRSAECSEHALAELSRFVSAGYLQQFDTEACVESFLGETPVLSKLHVLEQTRAGVTKHRLIFDAKASGLSAASENLERVLLPRTSDVIDDVLDLLKPH
eukprot:6491072-Amphidinium_carterae.1